jgi:hypothetical protein
MEAGFDEDLDASIVGMPWIVIATVQEFWRLNYASTAMTSQASES